MVPEGRGVDLLERAIGYTLGSLALVTPESLTRPTPCRDWDLGTLLAHVNDSFTALQEAVDDRYVAVTPTSGDFRTAGDGAVRGLRDRASWLLGAWTGADEVDFLSVGGCPVSAATVSSAGAVEVAVHGWDVARACGQDRPIPESLAAELLRLGPLLVTESDRPGRFAAQVAVPRGAGAAERLLAFLGRDPRVSG